MTLTLIDGMTASTLPAPLQEIADEFTALPARERLTLLLEYSDGLPSLPERFAEHREVLERVPECQTPLFLAVEVDDERRVHLFIEAPAESPTTRGFGGILREGIEGLPVEAVLGIPDDAPHAFGLGEAVSPLRLRGMVAMLSRIKNQVRAHS